MTILTDIKQKALRKPKNDVLMRDLQAEIMRMDHTLLALDGLDATDDTGAALNGASASKMRSDLERVIAAGGKRLRPILAYICFRLGGGQRLPILPLMCMLELMHTASLIHDDVVDGACLRRGSPTINATSGTMAAVGSGDFLLAEAMEYLHFYKGTGINEALVQASTQMCLGELRQLTARYEAENQTRAQYFLQIYRKTASLISASCFTGALAGGLPEIEAKMLKVYGEKLGVAFQLADDLLDFSATPEFGKTPGQDLQNGVLTLPVLYLLEEGAPSFVQELLRKKNRASSDISRLLNFIRQSKALEYTKSMIRRSTDEAVDALRSFPESAEKAALSELAVTLADRHS